MRKSVTVVILSVCLSCSDFWRLLINLTVNLGTNLLRFKTSYCATFLKLWAVFDKSEDM